MTLQENRHRGDSPTDPLPSNTADTAYPALPPTTLFIMNASEIEIQPLIKEGKTLISVLLRTSSLKSFKTEHALENLTGDPIPPGVVYADAPVCLSYDNEDGLENISAVIPEGSVGLQNAPEKQWRVFRNDKTGTLFVLDKREKVEGSRVVFGPDTFEACMHWVQGGRPSGTETSIT